MIAGLGADIRSPTGMTRVLSGQGEQVRAGPCRQARRGDFFSIELACSGDPAGATRKSHVDWVSSRAYDVPEFRYGHRTLRESPHTGPFDALFRTSSSHSREPAKHGEPPRCPGAVLRLRQGRSSSAGVTTGTQ